MPKDLKSDVIPNLKISVIKTGIYDASYYHCIHWYFNVLKI